MVPFAGYSMPVQYEGILAEHRWTREHAGLFDVSHMGQRFLAGPDHATTAAALEALTPGDFTGLELGRMRYTLLLNDNGGIVDDLMVTRSKSEDDDGALGARLQRRPQGDRRRLFLLAPARRRDAARGRTTVRCSRCRARRRRRCMARHCPKAAALVFMTATSAEFDGIDCAVSRSGYTGEDGFEISVPAHEAEAVARALLAEPEVKPIGLGARDSLRLEAGLPLYGHELDETTSPGRGRSRLRHRQAAPRRRRLPGREPHSARARATARRASASASRPQGRAPVREGAEIVAPDGGEIGTVTSGGFGPTVNAPVAMGYVAAAYAAPGTTESTVRGTPRRGAGGDRAVAFRPAPLPPARPRLA